MKAHEIALLSRADPSRSQLASYLRESGFSVLECEHLAIPARFEAVVVLDDPTPPTDARPLVQSWLKARACKRVIVVTPKPAGWKALALVHGERLVVLAAPAFAWQIIDALRAVTPTEPRGA